MYNFTYLKYFFDTAALGSMSAAARENSVSQSAISQGITKLEADLKNKLTTHQKRKFKLTEAGEIVYNESKQLLSALNKLKDKLSALKKEVSGELKFVSTNALAQYYLPRAYLQMRKEYPKVSLKLQRGGLNFIHHSLRNEMASFALVLDTEEFEGYDREIISNGSFCLYQHRDAKNQNLLVDHLESYEVIELKKRYHERYGTCLEMEALSGWALVLTFIQLGHGMGYLPDFMVRGREDLKEIKWDLKPIKYSICIARPKGAILTRAEAAFLNILRDLRWGVVSS